MLRSWRAGTHPGRTFTSALSAVLLGLYLVAGVAHAAAVRTAGPFSGGLHGATVTVTNDGRILVYGGDSASLWDPLQRRWEVLRSEQERPRRYLHTATTVDNERVILAGGLDITGIRGQQTALTSTTVWSVSRNIWEAGPGLLAPRFAHAAVAVPGSGVLLIGGATAADQDEPFGPLLATVELLGDKTTIARASMSAPRADHTATLLKDGRVMVIGGTGDDRVPLASVEIYTSEKNQWRAGPPLAIARTGHAANLLPDGRVLVTGGVDNAGNPVGLAEIWSADTAQWKPAGELLTPRVGHAAATLPDGSVLLSGGTGVGHEMVTSLEIWHATSSTWEAAGELPFQAYDHRAVLAPDGTVLLFGRDTYKGPSVLAWVPNERENLRLPSVSLASLVQLADGRFLLVGGQRRQSVSAAASVYDPGADRWISVAPMHYPRSGPRALRLADGRVLVLGGEVPSARNTRDRVPAGDSLASRSVRGPMGQAIPAEIWDPRSNKWSLSASLKFASGSWNEPALLGDGRVKLAAVNNQSAYSDALEYFRIWDPRDDSLTSLTHVRRTRPGGAALLYPDGHLLQMGGEDQVSAREGRACTAIDADPEPTEEGDREPKEPCARVAESAREGKRLDYWDPNKSVWQEAQPAPASINLMEVHALDDGGVLAWRRPKQQEDLQQPMLRWRPGNGWETLPVPTPLTANASLQAATTADGALLLIVNGQQSLMWSAEEHRWLPIAQDSSWENIVAIVNASGGRTLAFHGVQSPGVSFGRLVVSWLNVEAARWQPNTSDYVARDYPAILTLSDDQVMVAGGASAVVQIWSSKTGEWRYTGFLPAPLNSPTALKLRDGGVMIAGRVAGKDATVLCALWEPTSGQWSPCGEFPSAPAAERRPVVLRYLSGDQILLVHGDEQALVREADGGWVATKLDFPTPPILPRSGEQGMVYNTDIGSVWDPEARQWRDATDVLLTNRHSLIGTLSPQNAWVVESGNQLLQWQPADKTLLSIPLGPLPEPDLDGFVLSQHNCVLLWNNQAGYSMRVGGGYVPSLHARNLDTKVWYIGTDPTVEPFHAGAVVLEDGTVLLAGRNRNEFGDGSDWQRFRATCDQIVPFAAQRTLYLPTRTGVKSESKPAIASSSPANAPAPLPTGYFSTWLATVLGLIDTTRDHWQSTLILGGLLVLILIRLADRGSLYYLDESGHAPARVIDIAILLVALSVLLVASGAPWPAVRIWAVCVAAAAVVIAARRLWNNVETLEHKRLLALPLGGCAALSVWTIGGIATHQFVQWIDWLKG